MDIEAWRRKIDELDRQIVALISERAAAAQEIGRLKRVTSLPVYEPNRERVIFENVRTHNPGPLPDIELVHIYERIVDVMRALQRNELASRGNLPVTEAHQKIEQEKTMIVAMQERATEEEIQAIVERMMEIGFNVHRTTGAVQTILAGVGTPGAFEHADFEVLAGVAEVIRISSPYKLAGRSFRPEGTIVRFPNGVAIGGNEVVVMAGPCSVESREQIFASAELVQAAGAKFLRGGAFKPRSSPYSFQGLGLDGLSCSRSRRRSRPPHRQRGHGDFADRTDAALRRSLSGGRPQHAKLQPAARARAIRKPVLLKRGIAATIEELLLSAEYLLAGGNYDVILCERGIRTFETYTRNTMDISAIPVVQKLSHLPILGDPSHGTGRRDKVPAMARATVAAGGDGLLIEVHPNPDKALSDGAQSLFPTSSRSSWTRCA